MAEALGVAAGAIGIAGFTIQIVETVQKLKSFVSKVKFAHAQLEDLLDELDLLATLISQADGIEASNSLSSSEPTSKTPLYCYEKATKSILCVLHDVQKMVEGGQKHNTWASVKFVLKEKQIEDNLKRLERAKSMLLLAQQSLMQFQLYQVHQSRTKDITLVKEILNATHNEVKSKAQQYAKGDTNRLGPRCKVVQSSCWLLFGTILIASSQKEQTRRVQFSPAARLSWSWSFQLIEKQVFGRPHFPYRTFNIILPDNPARVACARGDIPELERLFGEGLATPYDVTNQGSTLLHTAASFHRADVCRMLLSYGVDVSATNSIRESSGRETSIYRRTPLMMATSSISPRDYDISSDDHSLLVDSVTRYEMLFFGLEDLANFEPKNYDAQDTIRTLMDYGSHNLFECIDYDSAVAHFDLPFEDSMTDIFSHVEDAECDELLSAARDLCKSGAWRRKEHLFEFGMKLFKRFIFQPNPVWLSIRNDPSHYPECLGYLIGTVLGMLPLVIQFPDQIKHVKSVLDKLLSDTLQHRKQSWSPLNGEKVRKIFPSLGLSPLSTILHGNGSDRSITIEQFEDSRNLAIHIWLSVLKDNGCNLYDYLVEERRTYLALSYWLRTNVTWYRLEGNADWIPFITSGTVGEMILDFVLDTTGEDPSVRVRLKPIDEESALAAMAKILEEERNVPGEWIE